MKLFTLTETSERLRTPVATLRYWRSIGEGPPSFKLGRRVVYSERALDDWLEEQQSAQNDATA